MDLASISRAAFRAAASSSSHQRLLQSRKLSSSPGWRACQTSPHRTFSSQLLRYHPATAAAQVNTPSIDTQENASTEPLRNPTGLDAKDEKLLNLGLDNQAAPGIAAKHKHHHSSPNAEPAASSTYAPEPPKPKAVEPKQTSADSLRQAFASRINKLDDRYTPQAILFPPRRTDINEPPAPVTPPPTISNMPYQALRITTRMGKSINVNPQSPTDLGTRIRQLERLARQSRIKQEAAKQRFHERPGLKRKRLHSERWRRRFKDGFVKIVDRVQELRRKGW